MGMRAGETMIKKAVMADLSALAELLDDPQAVCFLARQYGRALGFAEAGRILCFAKKTVR